MKITVLAGGVGGARFLTGVREWARARTADTGEAVEIRAVVNTGDDMWLAGVRVCPDLDSILYALAGVNDTERGWGRAGETERVSAELAAFGVGWPWFTLGDLDLGTHLARTAFLREGMPLTAATARIQSRWDLGVALLPATDDEVETHVVVADPETGLELELHFEEWWTRHRGALPALRFVQQGVASAAATPEALAAVADADVVLLAPSNPVVSIGTILGIPGIRDALAATAAPIVGVSPIIGGQVVRGMADACLTAIGVETSAEAVGRLYGARGARDADGVLGLLDGWLVDDVDGAAADALAGAGVPTRALPLWLRDEPTRRAIVGAAVQLAVG